MNCLEFQEKLICCENLLEISENSETLEHIDTCQTCRGRLELERKVREGFTTILSLPLPAELQEKILSIPLNNKPASKTISGLNRWIPWVVTVSFACACLLLFLIKSTIFTTKHSTNASNISQSLEEKKVAIDHEQLTPTKDKDSKSTQYEIATKETDSDKLEVRPEQDINEKNTTFTPTSDANFQIAQSPKLSVNTVNNDSPAIRDDKFQERVAFAIDESDADDIEPSKVTSVGDSSMQKGESIISKEQFSFSNDKKQHNLVEPSIQVPVVLGAPLTSNASAKAKNSAKTTQINIDKQNKIMAKPSNQSDVSKLDIPERPKPAGIKSPFSPPKHIKGEKPFPEPPDRFKVSAETISADKTKVWVLRDANIPRDARNTLIEEILEKNPYAAKEGVIDIDKWVLLGWLSAKDRVFLAPNPGFEWVARQRQGKWVVFQTEKGNRR